jgi:hypothetical protein
MTHYGDRDARSSRARSQSVATAVIGHDDSARTSSSREFVAMEIGDQRGAHLRAIRALRCDGVGS